MFSEGAKTKEIPVESAIKISPFLASGDLLIAAMDTETPSPILT